MSREGISFTQQVKEELVNNTYDSSDRLRALLSAYIRINATISFRNKHTHLVLKNENGKTAKFIYSTINSIYGNTAHMSYMDKGNTKIRGGFGIRDHNLIAVDNNLAAVIGLVNAAEDVHQRGLAGAVDANDAAHLTGLRGE